MGQLSDPQGQDDDDGLDITISGLPGEPTGPDPDEAAAPGGDVDTELVVELDTWSDIERDAVTDRLREAGIPHWWVDTSLHAAESDRQAVDDVLDAVDGEAAPLDPELDQVAYDMSEWDDGQLVALDEALDEAGIAHGWDDEELFVYASDEQAADELIDKVGHPHELPAEDDDGEVGGELLGELFVAADRLARDPEDHETTVTLLDLTRVAEKSEPPYGFTARDWDHLRERVDGLADLLRADTLDLDAVLAAAGDLRTSLRPYV